MYFPIIDVLKENFISKIPSIVTQWLTDNVDPVGSAVIVDESLSISGAAADAKVTGDEISDLKSDLRQGLNEKANNSNYFNLEWTVGKCINPRGGVTNISTCSATLRYYRVHEGDILKMEMYAPGSTDVVALYDDNKTLVTTFTIQQTTEFTYTVPSDGYMRFSNEQGVISNDNTYVLLSNPEYMSIEDLTTAIAKQAATEKKENDTNFWTFGYWAFADGGLNTTSTSWARSTQEIDDTIIDISCASDYKIFLLAYQGNSYIGYWNGTEFSTTYDTNYISQYIDVNAFREKYPSYSFRLDVTKIVGGSVTIGEVASNVTLNISLVKQQENTIKLLFGEVADSVLWETGTINSEGIKSIDEETYNKRISTAFYLRFLVPVTINPKSGYVFSVTTYDTSKTIISQFSDWSSLPYTLTNINRLYKIVIKASNNSDVSANNVTNYIESYPCYDMSLTRMLSEYANVKAVNHRGYNVLVPENTIPAYDMSADLGYKYVETDVLFTSDGVPVLMHDDTINRTCCNASDGSAISNNISIESITYSNLINGYDACTPNQWAKWKGTKVPTFSEFMGCCKARNLHPWIELKYTHTYTLSEIQQIISIIKQYGMEEHVTFISFSYDALALVSGEWETVELGLNGDVEDAERLKTGKNRVFMLYNYTSDYSDAINAGYQICLYTIDTESVLFNVESVAYDSILTNALIPSQVNDIVKSKYSAAN